MRVVMAITSSGVRHAHVCCTNCNRSIALSRVPEEPTGSDSYVIMVKLPDNTRLKRRVKASDTLQVGGCAWALVHLCVVHTGSH